jgi:hypothetical protein
MYQITERVSATLNCHAGYTRHMGTITLTALDTTVLHLLTDAPASSDQLAETVEYSYYSLALAGLSSSVMEIR